MDVCFDLPYKRQQVYQSDAEEILEVAEADHQPRQEQWVALHGTVASLGTCVQGRSL